MIIPVEKGSKPGGTQVEYLAGSKGSQLNLDPVNKMPSKSYC